jgi:hypothetical protein
MAEQKISYPVPESGEIDHVDLLMLDEMRKEALLQQKREELEREKRRLEEEAQGQPSGRESNPSFRGHRDRNKELYELGKHANQQRKDKSADEVAEEKWKHELTFKPSLLSNPRQPSKATFVPDYDRTVYRMQEARKSKEHSRPSLSRDDSPLLYLNVVMEGS